MKKFHLISGNSPLFLLLFIFLFGSPKSWAQIPCEEGYFFIEPGGCVLCEEGFILENMLGTDCYKCVRGEFIQEEPPRECEDPVLTALNAHLVIKTNGDDDGKKATSIKLEGAATITRSHNTAWNHWDIETISMQMTSDKPVPINIKVGRNFGLPPSSGRITPITPGTSFPSTSFFDVYVEIELGGILLQNEEAFRVKSVITEPAKKTKYHLDKTDKNDISFDGIIIKEFTLEMDKNIAKIGDDGRRKTNRSIKSCPEDEFLKIYPNPVYDQAMAEFYIEENADIELNIIDINGHKLSNIYTGWVRANELISIPVYTQHLIPGIYILQLNADQKFIQNKRIVVLE